MLDTVAVNPAETWLVSAEVINASTDVMVIPYLSVASKCRGPSS